MGKPDLWMPWYIADYMRDTMHLTCEQDGAYRRLIDAYWINGTALPDDDEALAAITKLPMDRWQKYRPTLIKFFTTAEGVWYHKRIEKELKDARDNIEQKRLAGNASAKKRWGNNNGKVTGVITDVTTGVTNTQNSQNLTHITKSNERYNGRGNGAGNGEGNGAHATSPSPSPILSSKESLPGVKGGNALEPPDYDDVIHHNGESQEPLRNSGYPTDEEMNEQMTDLQRIYNAYPKKTGERAARKAITMALREIRQPNAVEWLLGRVQAFAASPVGRGRFCKDRARWFNEGCYNDDPATWEKSDHVETPADRQRREKKEREIEYQGGNLPVLYGKPD